jgi:hypothetical protein
MVAGQGKLRMLKGLLRLLRLLGGAQACSVECSGATVAEEGGLETGRLGTKIEYDFSAQACLRLYHPCSWLKQHCSSWRP